MTYLRISWHRGEDVVTSEENRGIKYRVFGLRSRLKWSQEKFSWELNVSLRTVQRWEKGESIPTPKAIQAMKDLAALNEFDFGMRLPRDFKAKKAKGKLSFRPRNKKA